MMPSGETQYSFPTRYPDVLARGRDNVVRASLDYAGSSPTISAATFALLDPNGNTISGPTLVLASNIATVTIPAASLPTTLALGGGYQEVWTLTVGGVPRIYTREAALARYSLVPPATQADVSARQPSLSRALGAALTVQSFMDQAWEQVIRRLLIGGHLPYLIRTPDALREAYLLLSLALAYEACAASSQAGQYADLAKTYRAGWEKEWSTTNWQTDYDHDGRVDDPSARQSPRGGALHTFGSVPRTLLRGC